MKRDTIYISFDMDSTLADEDFDFLVWNEEIPKLYAEKYKLSIEQAQTKVYAEYYRALYVEKVGNWTDIDMWFKRLGLDNFSKLLNDMKSMISVYPDVLEILEYLSKKYKLIIITKSTKHFIDIKLEIEGLNNYFTQIFSAPDNFHSSKKNKEVFENVLASLQIKPSQLIHIGDDHHDDFEVPQSLGIKAFHLVRSGKVKHAGSISSLSELKKVL